MKHPDIVRALAQVVGTLTGQHPHAVLHLHGGDYTEPRSRIHRNPRGRSETAEARAKESQRSYHRIHTRKSRLIVRLCDQIADVMAGSSPNVGSAPPVLSCMHQIFASRILMMRGFRHEALGVARLALIRAKACDESTLVLQCLDILREMDHGRFSVKRRRLYEHEWRKWIDADHDRRIIETLMEDLLVERRHLHCDTIRRDIISARERIDAIRSVRTSRYLRLCDMALRVRLLLLDGKHVDVLQIVSRERSSRSRNQSTRLRWLQGWMSIAELRSLMVAGDSSAILEAISAFDKAQIARPHLVHELDRLEIIALMRNQQWDAALQRIEDADSRLIDCDDDLERQRVLLLKAYLHIASMLGLHSVRVSVPRITTLLNSLDLVLLDKAGLGVMARIYEVIHYVITGNEEVAERKVLNLQVYSTRNLRYGGSTAIRQFITGLQSMVLQKSVFLNDSRKVERLLSRISDEGATVQEQMLCPIPLGLLSKALVGLLRSRLS